MIADSIVAVSIVICGGLRSYGNSIVAFHCKQMERYFKTLAITNNPPAINQIQQHMPLSSLPTPFNYLLTQIESDLNHAADICREIRSTQRPNHRHELDALFHSLSNGPMFIEQERQKIVGIDGVDIDGGDGKCFGEKRQLLMIQIS